MNIERITTKSKSWSTSFELPALQPKRVVVSNVIGYLGPTQSTTINVTAVVYGDCFAEPRNKRLQITFDVEPMQADLEALVKAINNMKGGSEDEDMANKAMDSGEE